MWTSSTWVVDQSEYVNFRTGRLPSSSATRALRDCDEICQRNSWINTEMSSETICAVDTICSGKPTLKRKRVIAGKSIFNAVNSFKFPSHLVFPPSTKFAGINLRIKSGKMIIKVQGRVLSKWHFYQWSVFSIVESSVLHTFVSYAANLWKRHRFSARKAHFVLQLLKSSVDFLLKASHNAKI